MIKRKQGVSLNLIVLLIGFVCVFEACSSSNEDKAKRTVKDYLKENLDNFKSYDPVSWGNLRKFSIDSIKQNDSYYQEHLYSANEALRRSKELQIIVDSYKGKKDTTSIEYTEIVAQIEGCKARYESEQEKLSNYLKITYPNESCWVIDHKYRASNNVGALILNEETFYINEDCSNVINTSVPIVAM
ncbi:hypothetical protein [Bacteroides congonensis]